MEHKINTEAIIINTNQILKENDEFEKYELSYRNLKEKTKSRKTKKYINKYEYAKIISTRAQQIANNFPPLIKIEYDLYMSPEQIAIEEFKQNKIPLILRRYFPNGKYEDWKLIDLIH